jgi:hypothetical protein
VSVLSAIFSGISIFLGTRFSQNQDKNILQSVIVCFNSITSTCYFLIAYLGMTIGLAPNAMFSSNIFYPVINTFQSVSLVFLIDFILIAWSSSKLNGIITTISSVVFLLVAASQWAKMTT